MSREEFEAWISAPPFEKSIERQGEHGSWPGNYRDYSVQLAWCAWEDSAKAEREACAALVEGQETHGDPVEGWFEILAAKIRARSNAK